MKETEFEKKFQYPCQYCGECPVWLGAFEDGMGLDTWDDVIDACHNFEKNFPNDKCPCFGKYVTLEDIGNNSIVRAEYIALRDGGGNNENHR